MKKKITCLIAGIIAAHTGATFADWQYSGEYTYNPAYYDDGGRTVISLRAGASYAMSRIKNDVGGVIYSYCINPTTGEVGEPGADGSCAAGFDYAGTGNLGSVGMEDLGGLAFSAGASIGLTIPNHPQWRIELGWDHFAEVDYNETPLFAGDMKLSGGDTIAIESGSVQSTLSSDVVSLMAFYDFFSGLQKPVNTVIPYIGLGAGYADSKTVVNLSDPWGDLSQVEDLTNFGTPNDNGILQFYRSTTNTANVAGVFALGLSYGVNEQLFFDFGLRVTYLPRVKYQLVNVDDTRRLDWFSAKNLIYSNVMLGVRFEF
ncbi:MAG: hypothetical protein J5611_00130 [Alphaproteobacteria bacterium]|nr:hypothetical protein [Alphaproteobacteria bacterium]